MFRLCVVGSDLIGLLDGFVFVDEKDLALRLPLYTEFLEFSHVITCKLRHTPSLGEAWGTFGSYKDIAIRNL